MNYGMRFMTVYRRQGSRPSPRKRNAKRQNGCLGSLTDSCEKRSEKQRRRRNKKSKWLSEVALQIAVKTREVKGKGEKERYTHLNAEFQRIASRDKKAFLSDQCKDIEGNNRMGKTRDLFKKIEIPREHFMQKWAQ